MRLEHFEKLRKVFTHEKDLTAECALLQDMVGVWNGLMATIRSQLDVYRGYYPCQNRRRTLENHHQFLLRHVACFRIMLPVQPIPFLRRI